MRMYKLVIELSEKLYRQLVKVAISNNILPADAAENIICNLLHVLEKKGDLE